MNSDDRRFYILVCRDCDDTEIPFESAQARGRWAAEHARGTGHCRWLTWEAP